IPYINGKFIIPAILIFFTSYFYADFIKTFDFSESWDIVKERIPFYIFVVFAITIATLTFIKNLSLIPVLGLLSCSYLMTELGFLNWVRFLIWLGIGLV